MNSDHFYNLVLEIENYLGSLIGIRVYAAIIGGNGEIKYAREDFNEMISFIKSFILSNFNILQVGDHSFPMSGKNIGFFKISNKAMVILYMKTGHMGSLLAFKNKMYIYASRIDEQITDLTQITVEKEIENMGEISKEAPSSAIGEPPAKLALEGKFVKVPLLTKQITGKEKFPINEVKILQLCDGKHTIEDIIKSTNFTRLDIENVIRNYQKKKYLTLQRTQI